MFHFVAVTHQNQEPPPVTQLECVWLCECGCRCGCGCRPS